MDNSRRYSLWSLFIPCMQQFSRLFIMEAIQSMQYNMYTDPQCDKKYVDFIRCLHVSYIYPGKACKDKEKPVRIPGIQGLSFLHRIFYIFSYYTTPPYLGPKMKNVRICRQASEVMGRSPMWEHAL